MSSRRGVGPCSKPASQAVTRDSGNASLKADLLRVDTEIAGVDRGVLRPQEFAKEDPDNGLYARVKAAFLEKAGRTGPATAMLEQAVSARPLDDALAVAFPGCTHEWAILARRYSSARPAPVRRSRTNPTRNAVTRAEARLIAEGSTAGKRLKRRP